VTIKLRFPLSDVVNLIDQAHPADDTHPASPALWWTVDDGVVLTATLQSPARVHADGFGPGTAWARIALAGLDHAGPHPIPLTAQLAASLRDAAALGVPWAFLRLHPGHATITATDRPTAPARTFRHGQDPVAVTIEDRTGDTHAAGRPWQADRDHPDDILADLADVLDSTAGLHIDVTADLLAAAGQLRAIAEDIITDITTRGSYFHRGSLEAATARLSIAAARHEVTANTVVHLWAAWRNAHSRRP
jgi:hypothetical protein